MEHLAESQNCLGTENLNPIRTKQSVGRVPQAGCRVKLQSKMKRIGFYNRNTLARELTDYPRSGKGDEDHNIEFKRFELMEL